MAGLLAADANTRENGMEFGEKLQQLRKQKNMTQEELAKTLFVSRAAVSKWESGRGYPSIDSIKAISGFFCVSIDELLSGNELIAAAETDSRQKTGRLRGLVFGLLDCAMAMLLFLPFFGQTQNGAISVVPLLSLSLEEWYVTSGYAVIVAATVLWGILELILFGAGNTRYKKAASGGAAALSIAAALMFILSRQPYAASLALLFLIVKGAALIFER